MLARARPLVDGLRSRWSWEAALYLGILSLAAGLRLWDLGAKTLHHDESLHAYFSWLFAEGRGFRHDPMMHGTSLFIFTGFFFKVFGASDYTARLLQALSGIALVGLPYFLRGWLGRRGALFASLLLAISPSMTYVSRFARHDMLAATWALALAVCLWRYWDSRKPRYIFLGAAFLSLGFATMEVTFLYGAIFGSFLLVVAGWELLGRLRRRLDLKDISPPAAFALLLGTLALPQIVALSIVPARWFGLDLSSLENHAFIQSRVYDFLWLKIALGVLLLLISLALGLRWDWRRWLIAAAIFYGIYVLLYTTFFTNPQGFATGIWGSVDYWLDQHIVRRGAQPWYYYFMLLSTYEFLPLLFALLGAAYFIIRGDVFSRFLVYWAGASLVLYSYAGERMPWLMVHLALPLILLAARFLGEVFSRGLRWRQGAPVAALAVLPFAVKTSTLSSFDLLWPAALALGLLLYLGMRLGAGWLAQALLGAVLVGLVALTLPVNTRLSFQHSDIPVEPLVYTQSSPDVKFILAEIERLAEETGQGKDLEITVDGSDGYGWPWAWYLRDYRRVGYPCLASGEPDCEPLKEPPQGSVVLLNFRNYEANREQLQGHAPGVEFSLRWWFPEYYRQQSLPRLLFGIFDPDKWRPWWDFFIRRELLEPIGSSDALAFFPQGFQVREPLPSWKWR